MTGPRVLLAVLSERKSAKGNTYLSGWLGRANVVGFPGEPDKLGNPTWSLFVSEPEPRDRRAIPASARTNGHDRDSDRRQQRRAAPLP